VKKSKDLIESEGEKCGNGKGVGVYVTLFQSDTVQSYGLSNTVTSPVGVGLRKKLKDLIGSAREERGHGECVGVYTTQSKIKPNSQCRCDERLKTKTEESTGFTDTGLFGELEHLKIKTRLTGQPWTLTGQSKSRGGSGRVHGRVVQTELVNLQKNGQFPDDPVRIKVTRIHYVIHLTY
jgi:hypothetical protein